MISKYSLKYSLLLYFILFSFDIITKLTYNDLEGSSYSLRGYIRFFLLLMLIVFFLANSRLISIKENYLKCILISIPVFLILQLLFVENTSENISGIIKYYFYFIAIALPLSFYSDNNQIDIEKYLKLLFLFFVIILSAYPFIVPSSIYSNPFSYIYAISDGLRINEGLLGAANEDAHFLSTIFPLILYKLKAKKVLRIFLIISLFLVLFVNGTRSALVTMVFTSMVYLTYEKSLKHFYSTKTIYMTIISVGIFIFLVPMFSVIFQSEKNILLNITDLFRFGNSKVEGNFGYRIINIWYVPTAYTFEKSPFVGFGSGGWDYLATKFWILNPFNKYNVESPHNSFIYYFVNWGFIGLIFYVSIIFWGFCATLKALFNYYDINTKNLLLALVLSWFSFIVWSMIANAYGTHGWIILSILFIITVKAKRYNSNKT